MRKLVAIFIIAILTEGASFGTDYFNQVNQNSDCTINFYDFAKFADDWLTSVSSSDFDGSGMVDINDLAIFSDYWLVSRGDAAPIVQGASFSLLKNAEYTFDINATSTETLYYSIETLPVKGLVWDANGSQITTAPRPLSSKTVRYVAGNYNNESDGFTFAADDNTGLVYPCGGKTTATATIYIQGWIAPVSEANSITAYTYIPEPIALSATDDGLPNPPGRLRYVITSLPSDPNAYLQDPTPGGQSRIVASNLPYKLSSWGNTVRFATSTVGNTNFQFKAYDGNYYSDANTISISVSSNPQDCLSFDGNGGEANIPDTGNYYDIEPNKAIGVCFSTRKPLCRLFKKWDTGKGGYEVGLVGGFVSARVYDGNGTVIVEDKSWYRYDSGLWANIVIFFNHKDQKFELYVGYGEEYEGSHWFSNGELHFGSEAVDFPVALWPAGNDCNVKVGYKGEIDAIRTYTLDPTDSFRTLSSVQIRQYAGDTESFVPSPSSRFKCNYDGVNNTSTQIYDDVSANHLIGTFDANHVRYYPWIWFWPTSFQPNY